jgi:hypothetical protein
MWGLNGAAWIVLIGVISQGMYAHDVNVRGANHHLPAHQPKSEIVGLLENVAVMDGAPGKDIFSPVANRDHVGLRDSPSHIDLHASIPKSNIGTGRLLMSVFLVKWIGSRDIDCSVGFNRQIVCWRLPEVTQLSMSNEGEAAPLKGVNSGFVTKDADICPQLLLGCVVCAFYKVSSRDVKKPGSESQNDRESGDENRTDGSDYFFVFFYLFLIFCPAAALTAIFFGLTVFGFCLLTLWGASGLPLEYGFLRLTKEETLQEHLRRRWPKKYRAQA